MRLATTLRHPALRPSRAYVLIRAARGLAQLLAFAAIALPAAAQSSKPAKQPAKKPAIDTSIVVTPQMCPVETGCVVIPEVTPQSASDTVAPGTNTYSFTVKNVGSASGTIAFSAACSGLASGCSVSPTSASITINATKTVVVNYTAGTTGSGLVTFTAENVSGTYYSSQGTLSLSAAPALPAPATYLVRITPKDPTTVLVDSGVVKLDFTIADQGYHPGINTSYHVDMGCSGAVTGCRLSGVDTFPTCPQGQGIICATPPRVRVNEGNSVVVSVTFSALTRGDTGTVRVMVPYGSAGAVDTGYYKIKVRDTHYVVVRSVTPSISVLPGRQFRAQFDVTSVDTQPPVLALNPLCSGAAAGGACVVSADTLRSASGATTRVTVIANATDTVGQTGTAGLTATLINGGIGNLAYMSASSSVTVAAPAPLAVVTLDSTWAGDVVERDLCLTVSVGPAAASECGDLRLVHALPSIRTMNKARAPTLIYNSQHAHPMPIIAALVTPPASSPLPASVEMRVLMKGIARPLVGGTGVNNTVVSWPGSQWGSPGQSRRIAAAMDAIDLTDSVLYTAALEVKRIPTSGTPAVDTVWFSLPVVNRTASPFGAGWWLAGVETLKVSSMVWIGGDGSVRQYRAVPGVTGKWAATPIDHPDTIALVNGQYVRYLPDSLKVYFDAAGRHVATKNRLGHVTTFHYNGNGWVDTITVPTPGNGGGPRDPNDGATYGGAPAVRQYGIGYYGPSVSQVDSVRIDAPGTAGPGGAARRTVLRLTGGDLRRIQEPYRGDTNSTAFQYQSGTAQHRIWSRQDRRGTVNGFAYDVAGRLILSERGSGADTTRTRITPAESRAVVGSAFAAAHALSGYVTKIDGPRDTTTFGDTIEVRLNRFGAPLQSVDPLGAKTTYAYGDTRWPALVTRVGYHNGRTVAASYDSLGRVLFSTNVTRGATTRYTWDTLSDNVAQVRSPLGATVVMQYYAQTGNRKSQQSGSDAATQVTFEYYGSGLYKRSTLPGNPPDLAKYDNLGNLMQTVTPRGFIQGMTNDSLGRPVADSGQIDVGNWWQRDTISYDLAGLVATHVKFGPAYYGTRAQTLVVESYYNLLGQPERVVRYQRSDTIYRNGVAAPNTVGTITQRWTYDTLGRTRTEVAADGAVDSTWYDPAGNPVKVKTRRGDVINMRYDALNRLAVRKLPPVAYQSRYEGIPLRIGAPNDNRYRAYPRFPNDGGSGLLIPADSSVYVYDLMGNLTQANNRDAQVRRGYDVAGMLTSDTLRIRAVAPASVGQAMKHEYVLGYEYDLDGHRTALIHPDSLGLGTKRTVNEYDPATGMLSAVTSPLGARWAYHYNRRLELDTVRTPIGYNESYVLDVDGNLAQHKFTMPISGGTYIYRDVSFVRDGQGRSLRLASATTPWDTTFSSYSGMGYLVQSTHRAHTYTNQMHIQKLVTGDFDYDALGNLVRKDDRENWHNYTSYWDSTVSAFRDMGYGAGTGRQVWASRTINTNPYPLEDTTLFDASGNEIFASMKPPGVTAPLSDGAVDRASFYAADGKLYAADYRTYPNPYTSTFEEYRYDALGRRILTRARRYCEAGGLLPRLCKVSFVRRTVWDGNAELYEIQHPTDTLETPSDTVEGDTKPDTLDNGDTFDPNPSYGIVGYTYGGAVDQPLSVMRRNYALKPSGYTYPWAMFAPFEFLILWNETGQVQAVSVLPGGTAPPCIQDDPNRCAVIDTPGYWAAYGKSYLTGAWNGTLVTGKSDRAGTLYRRNRVYDPAVGRFTQEDPIGLAGGVNAYGFANGDPANFADPFGLCPETMHNGEVCIDLFIAAASAGGFRGDNRTYDPNAAKDRSRVQVVLSKDGDIIDAHVSDTHFGNTTIKAYPLNVPGGNHITSTKYKNGAFTVTITAYNPGVSFAGLGFAPAIDAKITFFPDGKGGFTTNGRRDMMPSIGVYQRNNGGWTVLHESKEDSLFSLFPWMPQEIW